MAVVDEMMTPVAGLGMSWNAAKTCSATGMNRLWRWELERGRVRGLGSRMGLGMS